MHWTFASHVKAPPSEASSSVAFTTELFGGRPQLAWLKGAIAISHSARCAYWGDRWAAVVEPKALTIISASDEYTVRLELTELALLGTASVVDGALWLTSEHGALRMPLAELEAVFAAPPPGTIEIHVLPTYPQRDQNARVVGKVAWLLADDALVNVERTQLRLDHRQYGLKKGMEVAFVDALAPGRYAAIDVPDRPRQILNEPLAPYTVTAKLVRGRPREPAIETKPLARGDDVWRLICAIAERHDDHDIDVMIDLLADLGEPSAQAFAQLRAGEPATPTRRREALGDLHELIKPVEFVGGLPRSGSLAKLPPDWAARMTNNFRLGLFESIRIGNASVEQYVTLLGSSRLVGLRRVDVPSFEVLRALKKAGRDKLTHLNRVKFTEPVAIALLADPIFASVTDLEFPIAARFATNLLQRLIVDEHDMFAYHRHLTFVEHAGETVALARLVLARFRELHNATVTVGGVTIRAGKVELARDADPAVVALARELYS